MVGRQGRAMHKKTEHGFAGQRTQKLHPPRSRSSGEKQAEGRKRALALVNSFSLMTLNTLSGPAPMFTPPDRPCSPSPATDLQQPTPSLSTRRANRHRKLNVATTEFLILAPPVQLRPAPPAAFLYFRDKKIY